MVRQLVLWSCVLVASTALGADPRWDKLSLPGGQQKVAPEVVAVFRAEVGEDSLGVKAIDISPDGTWVVHDSGPDRICVRNIADLSTPTIIQLKSGQLPRATIFYFSDDSRVMFHAGDKVAWDISLTPPVQNTVSSKKVDGLLSRNIDPLSASRAIGIPEQAGQGVAEIWDTNQIPPTLVAPLLKDSLLEGQAMDFHTKTHRIAIVTVRNAKKQKDIQTHVHVFSAVDGREIANQMIPNGMFQGVSFSPSGQQIITTSGEFFQAGVVQVHSISAQGKMKLEHSLTGDGKFVPTVWARFVNDGTEVMCVTSNRIVIIDAKTGLVSRTIEGIGGDINALAPDGKHLVTGYSRTPDVFVVRVAKMP